MKKVKQKIPAKINLTLDVVGANDKYHEILSLVASIDLCDTVTLIKRKDDIVTLKEKGILANCPVTENNAYKGAKLFMQTFHTSGVDIIIDKKIPVSGDLGGSSADAAAVLLGMNKLYHLGGALKPLADRLGSDTGYMLSGGYAVISGRGDAVKKLDFDKTLYLILFAENTGITARECYEECDKMQRILPPSTETAVQILSSNSANYLEEFASVAKNDLYAPAKNKLPVLQDNISALNDSGALLSLMTGSGSTTYGVYKNKRERDDAFKTLQKRFPNKQIIKAKTMPNKSLFEKTFYKYFQKTPIE